MSLRIYPVSIELVRQLAPLIERIALFRDASLKFLMYKDWDSYEQFLEEIIVARTIEEVVDALHRFSVFLETLLGQVNMRAVLADHPFDYPDVE